MEQINRLQPNESILPNTGSTRRVKALPPLGIEQLQPPTHCLECLRCASFYALPSPSEAPGSKQGLQEGQGGINPH